MTYEAKDVLEVIRSWWRRRGKKLGQGLRFAEVSEQLGCQVSAGSRDGRALDRVLQGLRKGGRIVCVGGRWQPVARRTGR